MQRAGGLWKPLAAAAVYNRMQDLLGAQAGRRRIVRDFLKVAPGSRFLDVGCGPAEILALLPPVDYLGIDLSPPYINRARQSYGSRARFEVGDVRDRDVAADSFDVVYGGGLLHHLDDTGCADLFARIFACLKPGGRAVFIDPAWEPAQNPIAHFLIRMDRGVHVRPVAAYAGLARSAFADVETHLIRNLLRLPYTHCVTICTRPGRAP